MRTFVRDKCTAGRDRYIIPSFSKIIKLYFAVFFFGFFVFFFAAFVPQCRMRGKDAVFMSADNVISYI